MQVDTKKFQRLRANLKRKFMMCLFHFNKISVKIYMYSKLITIKKKFIVIPVYQGKADLVQHYFAILQR